PTGPAPSRRPACPRRPGRRPDAGTSSGRFRSVSLSDTGGYLPLDLVGGPPHPPFRRGAAGRPAQPRGEPLSTQQRAALSPAATRPAPARDAPSPPPERSRLGDPSPSYAAPPTPHPVVGPLDRCRGPADGGPDGTDLRVRARASTAASGDPARRARRPPLPRAPDVPGHSRAAPAARRRPSRVAARSPAGNRWTSSPVRSPRAPGERLDHG